MQELIQRFWGFDKLLGPVLVKIVYYIGLAGVGIAVFFAMLGGLFALPNSALSGLAMLIFAPILGAVFLVYWRFLCEIFILAFETYNRLGEIRDRLPAPAPQEPSVF